jgi:ABC-type Fe3+ transport system permease subunit
VVAAVDLDQLTDAVTTNARYQAKGIADKFALRRYINSREDPRGILVGFTDAIAVFWRAICGRFWFERRQISFEHEAAFLPGGLATTMSHAVMGIPYVAFLVLSALSSYDITLEQASANLEARWWRTFWLVIFPQIRSGVIAGGMLAFLISFDQISRSLFVARGDTLPLRLLQHIQYNNDPSVAAVSTLLIAGALLLHFLFGRAVHDSQLRSLTAARTDRPRSAIG